MLVLVVLGRVARGIIGFLVFGVCVLVEKLFFNFCKCCFFDEGELLFIIVVCCFCKNCKNNIMNIFNFKKIKIFFCIIIF